MTAGTHSSSYRYYYAGAWLAIATIVPAVQSPQHLSQWATGLTFSFLIIIIVINLVINYIRPRWGFGVLGLRTMKLR